MQHFKPGIAWVVSLALSSCSGLNPAFALGKKRACSEDPPALVRCQPVAEIGVMVCLDTDGQTVVRYLLADPAIDQMVCHPALYYNRLWDWCLGTP